MKVWNRSFSVRLPKRTLISLIMIGKVVLLINVLSVFGYNLDTDFPIIYSDNAATNENYFGYSVYLHADPESHLSWLIVGSPKSDYSGYLKKRTSIPTNPGVVFRCAIGGSCEEIRPKTVENEDGYVDRYDAPIVIKKQYGWFGASMSIKRSKGLLTVCAPRTIVGIHFSFHKLELDTMQGMCYSGLVSSNALFIEDKDLPTLDITKFYWYNALHGISVHYPSSQKRNDKGAQEINRIIGAPSHRQYGTVEIQRSNNRILVDEPSFDDVSHFGYSVTSGFFFKEDQLLYASGAPGWQYIGQVGIMDPKRRQNESFVTKISGNYVGEYFGACLASGDVNNDNLDDLVIGAPHWGSDNGKVYVYFGNAKGQFDTSIAVEGAIEDGLFGYSVACGDLDMDGYADIIVGAPWEDDGAIYIYNWGRGLNDKNTLQMSQRISGEKLSSTIRGSHKIKGFGFSVSEPIDIDENGYPDFAVGAYKSGTAIVLRTKPVVKTHILVNATPNILRRDAEQFAIEICHIYEGYNITNNQVIELVIMIDPGFQRTKETIMRLTIIARPKGESCANHNVTIMENIQNFIEPISIFVEHEFVHNETDHFCKTCPMETGKINSQVASAQVQFDIGCGEDSVCNSNISASATFHDIRENNTWVIGSNDISLEVNMQNFGEPAYVTTLVFTFPDGIILRSVLPSCQEDTSSTDLIVICDVGNPMGESEVRSIKLDLDMRHLTNGSLHASSLDFLISINTRSKNHGTVNITETLNLVSEVYLSLNGKANEESYYLPILNDDTLNVTFQHTYQVYKLGATPVENAQLVVKIPTSTVISTLVHVYEPRLYISGKRCECISKDNVLFEDYINEVEGEATSDELNLNLQMRSPKKLANGRRVPMVNEEDINANISHETVYSTNIGELEVAADALNSMKLDIIYMNCTNETANCSRIICDLSALKTLQDVGKLAITFLLDVGELKDSFAVNRKILKFSTEASVEIISPPKRLPNHGIRTKLEIVTVFYNTPRIEKMPLWIILVSVFLGLILLLGFAAILRKLGFFQRTGKQDLQSNKNEEVEENKETSDADEPQCT